MGVALLAPGRARRSGWPDPLFTTAGLALGLTIHPSMDGSFAPWRFAAYHLFTMGVDRDGLYPRVAEFHAFPPDMLWQHPEWGLLLLATLVGLAWVLRRRLRGEELPLAVAATAGLAAAGLVLGAKALRATEYAVPMLAAFLATLPPVLHTPSRRWVVGVGFALVLLGGAWLTAGRSAISWGGRGTLNTRLYEGAAPVLAQHAGGSRAQHFRGRLQPAALGVPSGLLRAGA